MLDNSNYSLGKEEYVPYDFNNLAYLWFLLAQYLVTFVKTACNA